MGMSADFETAIAFGATHVRVGSQIFGAIAAPRRLPDLADWRARSRSHARSADSRTATAARTAFSPAAAQPSPAPIGC